MPVGNTDLSAGPRHQTWAMLILFQHKIRRRPRLPTDSVPEGVPIAPKWHEWMGKSYPEITKLAPFIFRMDKVERAAHSGIFDGKLSHVQKIQCSKALRKVEKNFHPNLTKLGCPLGLYT